MASSSTAFPRTHTDWPAVIAAACCGVAVAMNIGKVPIAMPELRAEFGLTLVASGWMASMINTMAVLTGLMFGLLSDRVGALKMCLFGLAMSILGGAASLFVSAAPALLFSRFIEGLGLVSVAVSAPALLSAASSGKDRRFALAIWSAYLPAGVGIIMLLAPLMKNAGQWRGLWVLALAAILVSTAALVLMRGAYRQPRDVAAAPSPLITAREALSQPQPWLLAFAMTTWTIQHFALIIWLPTFLSAERDLPLVWVSLLSCLMVLINVPGNLLGGSLLQRGFKRGNLIVFASLVTGLCNVGIFLDGLPDLVRYALCLLLSFVGGLIPASVLSSSVVYARSPKQVGTLQGLFMQMGNLGPFAGPPLIAAIVALTGHWQYALIVTGTAAVIGLFLGLAVRRYESALPPAPLERRQGQVKRL